MMDCGYFDTTRNANDPVTRLKLSMGPIWGPYSLYPRYVRASMPPKKETKYSFNAFQMASQKSI